MDYWFKKLTRYLNTRYWLMILGGISEGDNNEPDAVFLMSDDDFVKVVNGDEDPQ